MAAFRGMHVSPAKHPCSYAWLLVPRKCDYQTDTRTDRRRTKCSLCAAMLRRRHKNWEMLQIRHKIGKYSLFEMEQAVYMGAGAAVAEWLNSWLAEQEDRGSIPGLATWIFRDWLYPASKSRYGWKIAKSTLILKTTNQPIYGCTLALTCLPNKVVISYNNTTVDRFVFTL